MCIQEQKTNKAAFKHSARQEQGLKELEHHENIIEYLWWYGIVTYRKYPHKFVVQSIYHIYLVFNHNFSLLPNV